PTRARTCSAATAAVRRLGTRGRPPPARAPGSPPEDPRVEHVLFEIAEDRERERARSEEPPRHAHDVVVRDRIDGGRDLVERDVAAEVDHVLRDPAHAAVAGLEPEHDVALHLVLDAPELLGAEAVPAHALE